MTATKSPSKKKSTKKAAKVGRNPFAADAAASAPVQKSEPAPRTENAAHAAHAAHSEQSEQAHAEAQTEARAETRSESASSRKQTIFEKLDGVLSWKLKQFSVLRYEKNSEKGKLSLLNLAFENPKWKFGRNFEFLHVETHKLPLKLSAISVRIHSA